MTAYKNYVSEVIEAAKRAQVGYQCRLGRGIQVTSAMLSNGCYVVHLCAPFSESQTQVKMTVRKFKKVLGCTPRAQRTLDGDVYTFA